ncbi:MAG: glycosyltransferase family 4 protein [Bacilli bacterium]
MKNSLIIAFLVTFSITIILTPIIKKISLKLGIVSYPGQRHVHSGIIPRLGGLAIYSSFIIGTTIFMGSDKQILSLIIGAFIIVLSGVIDDMIELKPLPKLGFQLVATFIVIFYGGIRIYSLNLPGGLTFEFGILSTIVTIIWIIGITNAVNLIDGLDGLCVGVSSIILATFAVIAYLQQRDDIVLLSIITLGSVVGMLFYNFYPASIFIGDTGALFIGYMIASISLLGFKSQAFLTLGPAILLLALPILDTLLSIIRRKVKGVSIASPDKEHLHHTLMFKLNLSQQKTVLVIYGITFYFSQVSFVYMLNKRIAFILLIIMLLVIEIFIEKTAMISKRYHPILSCLSIFKIRRKS